jgi:hypothetical protein
MPFSSNFVFGRSKAAFRARYMSLYGIAYSIANTIAPLYGTTGSRSIRIPGAVDHARLSGHPGVARVLVVTEAYKPLIPVRPRSPQVEEMLEAQRE